MQNPDTEILLLFYSTILFWMLVVTILGLLGQRREQTRLLRERMWESRLHALIIAAIYVSSVLLSGQGINPYAIAIFCQVLMGLAIARSLPDFEPLPVLQSVLQRNRIINKLFLWIGWGLVAGLTGIMFGAAAMSLGQNLFHETPFTEALMREFSVNKIQAFFLFLAGGGIAEEAASRLVLLSLVWTLTKRPGLAIFVSAACHSAYHLTPLNPLNANFLQFPLSQLVSGLVLGLLWGYVFIKRGFETAALAHTLSDWLPILLFM